MGDDVCQHITEDNKVCGKGGQFFFGQTFAELAGDRGEIKKVGTAVHTSASAQSFLYSMQETAHGSCAFARKAAFSCFIFE